MLVLIQSTVISAVFGANGQVDIMFYLMSIIVAVTSFTSAINQLVLVADIMKVKRSSSCDDYKNLVRFLYTIYIGVGLIIFAAFFFFGQMIFTAITGFDAATIAASLPMIRVMSFVVFFSIINSYLLDIFSSYKIFIMPMINDLIKSIMIIGFVLIPIGRGNITMIAAGMLAAYVIQFVSISISFKRVSGFHFGFGFTRLSSKTKRNSMSVVIAQTANFLQSMAFYWVVSILPAGYFTAISLARKLAVSVMNVMIVQFAVVVGIDLIDYNNKGDNEGINQSFNRYLKTANYVLLPMTAIIIANAVPIIKLLFGHGKFSQASIIIAGNNLAVFSLILIVTLWDVFFQRLIVAKQLQHKTYLYQVAQSIVTFFFVLGFYFILGYIGIGFGLVTGNLLYDIVIGRWLLHHNYRFMRIGETLIYTFVNMCFATFAIGFGLLIRRFFYHIDFSTWQVFVYLFVSSILMLGVYVLIGLIWKPNRMSLASFLSMLGITRKSHISTKHNVCLACSSGGHLTQILQLVPVVSKYDYFILTEDCEISEALAKKHRVHLITLVNRKMKAFPFLMLANAVKTWKILRKEKPDSIISTGALSSVAVCYIGKLLGCKVIFIESFAKVRNPTISGKLVHPIADVFIVQHKPMLDHYKKAVYGGSLY
jgi:peptidoglycan biosynthesis protein MviN/MurJ (putative lipid II flippase)